MSEEDGGGFDPDGELATLALAPEEDGTVTFGIRRRTYRSLASSCLSVQRDLMTIRRLRDSRPGCVVEIFGRDLLVTVYVADGAVSLFEQGLDDCVALELLSVSVDSGGWAQAREKMRQILGGHERCD